VGVPFGFAGEAFFAAIGGGSGEVDSGYSAARDEGSRGLGRKCPCRRRPRSVPPFHPLEVRRTTRRAASLALTPRPCGAGA
jgi:hypothetical protein